MELGLLHPTPLFFIFVYYTVNKREGNIVKNIFCIVAKSGGGKTRYMKDLTSDSYFMNKMDLSLLTYGTTRAKRSNEIEGIDYHFHTKEDYEKIPEDDLIEYRSYYTMNNGTVYYFTKKEYFENRRNILCLTSPYQYESYRNWIAKQNIKGERYRIFMILINTDLKIRVQRLLERAENDADIYEFCRRVMQEKNEFEDVGKRIPEFLDPMMATNVCYIDNNSPMEVDILCNLMKIKEFIKRSTFSSEI